MITNTYHIHQCGSNGGLSSFITDVVFNQEAETRVSPRFLILLSFLQQVSAQQSQSKTYQ